MESSSKNSIIMKNTLSAKEWLPLIVAVLIVTIGVQYLRWKKSNKLKKLGVLHPKAWPVIGNSAALISGRMHYTDLIESIYRLNEDAYYVGFHDFKEAVILIRSPELLKSIVVKNFDHFTDHRYFVDPELNPLFSKNLFTLRGEKWKEVRNLLTPAFTGSKMKYMFELMSDCGKNFVDYLVNVTLEKSHVVDSRDILTRYANDVVATCAFGISVNSMEHPTNTFYMMGKDATNFNGARGLKMLLVRLFPPLGKLIGGSFFPPHVEKFFEHVVRETVEMRDREGITRPDMIQSMMETKGNESHQGRKLTILDMTAQAVGFFFGGFESVATAMCLVAHEIAIDAKVQQKMRDEIDEVVTATSGKVTYEAINDMPYLDAVVNETLRLYPINMFIERLCTKSFELPPALPGRKPITIAPGQSVFYPTFSIQRDSKYYPNPEKFDPERFMGSVKSNVNPFAYLPFGIGPRMCIANRFALLEIKVLFFHLLAKCYLKPRPEACSPMKLKKRSFNFMPEEGFWLEMEPRNAA
ncbi:cytochrome P450 9e2-like [Venturia canescens]|uniref:cytochrome P450 9e2-like n=1 Tax=Venturia canescens TaxID=32260 RepID=UPI001C9C976D|nr:cytochrome P450 9e2-like [Venturia canescens]